MLYSNATVKKGNFLCEGEAAVEKVKMWADFNIMEEMASEFYYEADVCKENAEELTGCEK